MIELYVLYVNDENYMKLMSYNRDKVRISVLWYTIYAIRSAKNQNCFKLIPENQPVVYANQPIVFISTLQKHRLNSFNSSEG